MKVSPGAAGPTPSSAATRAVRCGRRGVQVGKARTCAACASRNCRLLGRRHEHCGARGQAGNLRRELPAGADRPDVAGCPGSRHGQGDGRAQRSRDAHGRGGLGAAAPSRARHQRAHDQPPGLLPGDFLGQRRAHGRAGLLGRRRRRSLPLHHRLGSRARDQRRRQGQVDDDGGGRTQLGPRGGGRRGGGDRPRRIHRPARGRAPVAHQHARHP